MTGRLAILLAGWLVAAAAQTAGAGWQSAFLFDRDNEGIEISDFAMPSATCGIALGEWNENGRVRPVVVVSRDGGRQWTIEKLPKPARSFDFPPSADGAGWLVAEDGIHETPDCGKTWKRVSKLKNVLRVKFIDRAHGYAMGAPKKVWTTADGGRNWEELPAASEPRSDPERSLYHWAEFHRSGWGMIVGLHRPRRRDTPDAPVWMDPEATQNQRQWPALALLLQTPDGGKSWIPTTESLLGTLTRVRFAPDGKALLLVAFEQTFDWPSEVLAIGADRKKTERVFRSKTHATTDILFDARGTAYVAGYEPPGSLRQVPIPGKVAIGRSTGDLSSWEWMPVDYRAVAQRVMLARDPGGAMWAATDTGMILRLEQER